MKLHSTKKIVLYFSLLLAVASCKDDEEDVNPDLNAATGCKLTQVTFEDDDEVNKIEYNSAGYVTKITETDDDEEYTTTYIYDANNRIIKEENREDGQLDDYTTYEYTNNLVTSRKYYDADGTLEYTENYKYDANNRKIEETDDSDYKSTFTYDANGNLSIRESYYLNTLSYRETYENYDDKPTFLSAIKGFPSNYLNSSKNNPGKSTNYYDADGDGNIDMNTADVTTYTYKYNNNGLPTEVKETDSSGSDTTLYTYQCN